MKTKNILFRSALVFAASAVLFTSCRREEEDNDTSASSDNALAESTFNDITNIADEAGKTGTLSNYRVGDDQGILSTCAVVTIDSLISSDQDTITVDFGSTNCTGNDGRNRRGKIKIYYTGNYRDVGATHTITFDNYFVNENQVLGTKTVVNNGPNGSGNTVFSIDVNGQI
ncbi:MAG: hypothetical protein ACRCYO_01260, partial [Bacteroidia bacterium]